MLWRLKDVLKGRNLVNPVVCNFRRSLANAQPAVNIPSAFAYDLKPKDEIEGFRVVSVNQVVDFNSTLIELKHMKTGTRYVHVDRNDANNVFCVAFRTTPFNSTGAPHILEHLVLCGSEKYPCRDPFMKMLHRSLATYLNAWTYPDFTAYPFSTQNQTDYYNLMGVYMDAVFKPHLRELDFKQEGWRLEHEDVNDPKSPIIFKGVVFNEMKGVFSENSNLFMEAMLNNLLPSHTYGVISGGHPLSIPELDYTDLRNFHRKYYHPSNARIYSYGNMDFRRHLKYVNQAYLDGYQAENVDDTAVPSEPRWSDPRTRRILARHDPLTPDQEKQSSLGVGYLCDDIRDASSTFTMKVIADLLMEGPNAPFYKSLIERDLGNGYCPGAGYDAQVKDTVFYIGLQGLKEEDLPVVSGLVRETLEGVVECGFEQANVENVLHGIELGVKHQSADFGLNLLTSISSLWNHEGVIAERMRIGQRIREFRESMEGNPKYLQEMVDSRLLSNKHRLTLAMTPDKGFECKLKERENNILVGKISKIKDLSVIYKTGLQLRKDQDKKEDASCLPTLTLDDIKEDLEMARLTFKTVENVPIQECVVPTNGVSYFRAMVDTAELPTNLRPLMPLFCNVVASMGTASHDYREFDRMCLLKTGGLDISTHVTESLHEAGAYQQGICFHSHCLDRNAEGMFDLWRELFQSVVLTDGKRFTTLTQTFVGNLLNDIAGHGHVYASLHASAKIDVCSAAKETLEGLTHVLTMKEMAARSDLSPVLVDMAKIADFVLSKNGMKCALNVMEGQRENVAGLLKDFVGGLNGRKAEVTAMDEEKWAMEAGDRKCHHVLPFAVNYAAKSVPSVPFMHPDYAALKVACKLLTNKYLNPMVREKGGAYGAGVGISPSGVLQFYSYRDPGTLATFEVFDASSQWVGRKEFDAKDVDEAKLQIFQTLDAPIPPSGEGMLLFLNGITPEDYNAHRRAVLRVNWEDIVRVVGHYMEGDVSSKVLIGPEADLGKGWAKIRHQ